MDLQHARIRRAKPAVRSIDMQQLCEVSTKARVCSLHFTRSEMGSQCTSLVQEYRTDCGNDGLPIKLDERPGCIHKETTKEQKTYREFLLHVLSETSTTGTNAFVFKILASTDFYSAFLSSVIESRINTRRVRNGRMREMNVVRTGTE